MRVRLKVGPNDAGGLLMSRLEGSVTTLEKLTAYLAPAADVDIQVATDEHSNCVVRANDWTTIAAAALLRRLAPFGDSYFNRPAELIEVLADRVATVGDEVKAVARIAVAGSPPSVEDDDQWFDVPALLTVGGFNTEQRLGGLAGVIAAEPTTADRMKGRPLIDSLQWAEWGTGQAAKLRERYNSEVTGGEYTEWGMTLDLLSRLGSDLDGLYVARDSSHPLTCAALVAWMAERDSVILLRNYEVHFRRGPDDVDRVWDRETHAEVRLNSDVITPIDDGGRYGDWDLLPDPRPDKSFLSPSDDESETAAKRRWLYHYQRDVEGVLLNLVAEAWQVSILELLESVSLGGGEARIVAATTPDHSDDVRLRYQWAVCRPR